MTHKFFALSVFLLFIYQMSAQDFSVPVPLDVSEIKDYAKKKRAGVFLPPSKWRKVNKLGINLNESAFVNWNSGGSNSVSGQAILTEERNYRDKRMNWKNRLTAKYGINSQEGRELRKTDDELQIVSDYGYRRDTLSNWFYSGRIDFRTQFTNGFRYPNTENPISSFMAPGYLFTGIGAEYGKRVDNLSLYFSPLTYKSTFVLDQELANRGAFGVRGAERDADGNIIREGENMRNELGILFNGKFKAEIFDNIVLNTIASLYTDYLNSFGNVDVDWEMNLNFKVNSFVAATFGSHLRYDNDVKTTETNAEGDEVIRGPAVQWKQQLGIGVILDF
ncbi:MAG: DUF3078 domain-containing protein [Leeuwenhoekiella sp.]